MNKRIDSRFSFRCYRYAPEQFHAWWRNADGSKQPINLTPDECSTCGYAFLTKGGAECRKQLKRILRKRAKRPQLYTFGYQLEGTDKVVYLQNLTFHQYSPAAMDVYRMLVEDLRKTGWKATTIEHKLDEAGRVIPNSTYAKVHNIRPEHLLRIRLVEKEK